jgi:hypothetical protein
MGKKTRILIYTIGGLSILSSIYGIVTQPGETFNFSGIFIGITLIGVVYIENKKSEKDNS